MNQKEQVMEYLHEHGSITPMEAIAEYGITKLSTVVSLLIRKDGVAISKKLINGVNRFGKRTCYMEYRLEEDAK